MAKLINLVSKQTLGVRQEKDRRSLPPLRASYLCQAWLFPLRATF